MARKKVQNDFEDQIDISSVLEEQKAEEEQQVSSEETIEETPVAETKVQKAKKKIKEDLSERIQKKNNLTISDNADIDAKFMTIEEAPKKRRLRMSKKELEQLAIEEELAEEKLINNSEASYVQVIQEKHGTRKVIRYNPDPNTGLSTEVVEFRKTEGLVNAKSTGSSKTIPQIIFSNIFTFFNLLTYGIAAWLISIGAWKDLFFVLIVTFNLVIGTFQEIRSKKIVDKLSIMSAPTGTIIRDGDTYDIPVNEVVLDDVLSLSTGKQIPADSIVLDGGIEVNESLLTGESDSITKKPGDILYAGSYVVSGNCRARVEKVGKDNYIDKLTSQAKQYKKPQSELLGTLTWIIRIVAVIIIPLGSVVFIRQLQGGMLYVDAVRKTAGAMIGMIPSGLFLLTSVALFVGVIRLSQNNTLVQELYCIEMLARVDVLCLDKTGTITDGSMSVKSVIEYPADTGVTIKNAISAMQNALNSNNITDKALEEKFGRAKRIKHIELIPFSSARKYSAVEFERYGTFLLGAPEFILTKSFSLVAADVSKAAAQGYRVLLLAHSEKGIVEGEVQGEISPVALILIEDTIRDDAIQTIQYFKESGVELKVISGDNPLTVSKISERAGIENASNYISLDGLTDKEVIRAAGKYTVFGRVSPSQKKLLVMTLKEMGHTVAMTGDGVNDILALKEADCSIAIASGSEAARNVSHLVLLDSNFGSMPKVVQEGRRVINNVQRVASLFLTKTIFSFILAVYCCFIGKYPIATSQLILIDFFVIGIPSFILALEPNNSQVKGRFLKNVIRNALPGALAIAFTTALVFLLTDVLVLSEKASTTIIVVNATVACFMVFFKVCKPFNVVRKILYFVMGFFAFLAVVSLPDFFEFASVIPLTRLQGYEQLPASGILLLLCLSQATYPLIWTLENLIPWIKHATNSVMKLIGKMK